MAASLSDVTAVSSTLVAVEIAVSALVSVFADAAALDAATFSRADAELTRVAAEETVRGVTATARVVVAARVAVTGFAAVRAAVLACSWQPSSLLAGVVVLLAAVARLAAVVLLAGVSRAVRVALVFFAELAALVVVPLADLAALAGLAVPVALAVRAAAAGRAALAIRAGAAFLSADLFVGGTSLPPIWITERRVSYHGE